MKDITKGQILIRRQHKEELEKAIQDAESRGFRLLQIGTSRQEGYKIGVKTTYWARMEKA